MRVWLLRHGEAVPEAPSDAERALTLRGRGEVLWSAERLKGRAISAILASPFLRAQQTAELVRGAVGFRGEVVSAPWATPEGDVRGALGFLDTWEEGAVLLVSHNPFLGELAGLLVHGHREQPVALRTGSLVELEGEFVAAGLMRLVGVVHPG